MKFLILSRLPEVYSSRRLVQELKARDHELYIEHPESNYLSREDDIVIPRLGSVGYAESMRKLVSFSQIKPHSLILNPPVAFHQARHKRLALEALKDLPQPQRLEDPAHFPVVIKDCLVGQGHGVFLCRSQQELEKYRQQLQGREILFQEFIADCAGRDVRAFTLGTRVLAAIERVSSNPETEFRSNLSLGGKGAATTLSPQEEELCRQAVALLGLHYAGVDFVRSNRGPLLLEVNPCPGLEGIEKYTGVNIAKEIILYAESVFASHSK